MTACIDDERRRVAERLRRYVKTYTCPTWRVLCGIVLGGDNLNTVRMIQTLDRLADLIEPNESGQNRDRNQDSVQKESPIVQIEHECDREACGERAS